MGGRKRKMYCGNCGNQVRKGIDYCGKCGAKMNENVPKVGMKKSKFKKPTIIVIAVCIAIIASIASKNLWKKEDVVKICEYEYPQEGRKGKKEYNELGDIISLTETTDGVTVTENYTWEYGENLKKAYLAEGGLYCEIEMNEKGQEISKKYYNEDKLSSEYYYEYEGDLLKSHKWCFYYYNASGELSWNSESYVEYGENANLVSMYSISGEDISNDSNITGVYYEYNEYEEVTSKKDVKEGIIETTIYENQRNQNSTSCVGRAFVYDENEKLVEEYDVYEYEYDKDENMISECKYNSAGILEASVYREYDKNGNVVSLCEYNSEGELETSKYWEYDKNGNVVSLCEYNSEGELEERTYKEYNKNGSLLSKYEYTYPEQQEQLEYVCNYTYYE